MSPVVFINAGRVKRPDFNAAEDAHGRWRHITVKDNGIGFDEGYKSRIFGLFHRLNSKDKFEGTGIGLAITKKIVEKHGVTITADSTKGSGAVFTIILPMEQ